MRELTGRKVFAITASFFGVVIAVNMLTTTPMASVNAKPWMTLAPPT